jgi:hypothetical protein
MRKTRNSEVLQDFIDYCIKHPDERFWQALRNWCGWLFIEVTNDSFYSNDRHYQDTYNWEGKDT